VLIAASVESIEGGTNSCRDREKHEDENTPFATPMIPRVIHLLGRRFVCAGSDESGVVGGDDCLDSVAYAEFAEHA
jgi:hypothetical protein